MPTLRIHRLRPDAAIPAYQSEQAAGLDLAACVDESMRIDPGTVAIVPTGLAIAIPPGHEGQVRPRSGLATRHAVTVVNAPGTIDSDYRGELKVALINLGYEPFEVRSGDRVAQLVVAPIARVVVEAVESLDETARGEGGFGSTGVRTPALTR